MSSVFSEVPEPSSTSVSACVSRARVAAVGYSSVNGQATVSQEASLNETIIRLDFVDDDIRLPANTRVKVWIRTL